MTKHKSNKKIAVNKKIKKGISELEKAKIIQGSDNFIFNWLNGEYYLEIYNFLVAQYQGKSSVSKLDGVVKPKSLLLNEALVFKNRAMKSHRMAYFNKIDLLKLGVSVKAIEDLKNELVSLPAKRDKYDMNILKDTSAQFVNV